MGWIGKLLGRDNGHHEQADGLLTDGPLEGPYRHREVHPLTFASGMGVGLALLSVYDTPHGPVAFIVPADLGKKVGDAMINFVESVATEVKTLVPDVTALVLMWPQDNPNARAFRVFFDTKLDAPAPAGGQLVIITDETTHASTPGGRTEIYADPVFWNYRKDEEPFTVQDIPERAYTYTDVDQRLAHIPGAQSVMDQVLRDRENAWTGFNAVMKEWGLD